MNHSMLRETRSREQLTREYVAAANDRPAAYAVISLNEGDCLFHIHVASCPDLVRVSRLGHVPMEPAATLAEAAQRIADCYGGYNAGAEVDDRWPSSMEQALACASIKACVKKAGLEIPARKRKGGK